jgi:hypothetical protein
VPSRARSLRVGAELLVDGVADASLEGAKRFLAGLAFGEFALVVGGAGCVVRDLGDRGECRAELMRRLPRGLSRCRCRGPDDGSIGAVPL